MAERKQKFSYLDTTTIDLGAWLSHIGKSYPALSLNLIKKAIELADRTSKGLTTFYGQPCIEQSLEMAEIILNLNLNEEAVAASLMISTVQHTDLSVETIKKTLGETVAKLVMGERQMSVLNQVQANIKKTRDSTQIDRLRKTFLAMVSDIRIVLIRLAEQLCLLRNIKNINTHEQKKIAQEILDIYAPLANRLGIGQLKWQLEDLAFYYLNPEIYKMIAAYLAERRIDREYRIQTIIGSLQEILNIANIPATVSGRAKHIYSIYTKMQKKNLDFKNIYDANALRILVPSINDCYTVLSKVHHIWEPLLEEFDDYIARPKPNGYRSVHTAVRGPGGTNLEIQIRTYEMHTEAENGFAAHWLYKENQTLASDNDNRINFLRQLLAWHKEVANTENKPELNYNHLLENRIYVFTPGGDIIDLPQGATPLDFAYYIHTELGHRCRGAKVNGHIVQLTHLLCTGDRIEIITSPNATPSRDWINKELGYLKTSRARSKVIQWFRQQNISPQVEIGKNILDRELAKANLLTIDLQKIDLKKIALQLNFKTIEGMWAAIGHGSLRVAQIIYILNTQSNERSFTNPISQFSPVQKKIKTGGFQIDGVSDLLSRIAKCCKPIPGDAIIGFITRGRGVSIHQSKCDTIKNFSLDDPRLIQVSWHNKVPTDYYVDLYIRAASETYVLKEITATLANAKINLISLHSNINKKSYLLSINLTIKVNDIAQLHLLISQIKQLPNVHAVDRKN